MRVLRHFPSFAWRWSNDYPEIAPERVFYAIGDIHGSYDLLCRAFDVIRKDNPIADIVLLGDYIDKGENSKDVLTKLYSENLTSPTICLAGNHEDLLLRFLQDPDWNWQAWYRHGGLQTLESFNIFHGTTSPVEVRDRLFDRLGDTLVNWLTALPLYWESGNVIASHAGAHPGKPMSSQSKTELLWGGATGPDRRRKDGKWVIHGHRIVDEPVVAEGQISIDTGAFTSGHLTIAKIVDGEALFHTVRR